MNFLKQLLSILSPKTRKDTHLFWVYVQCEHCKEQLRIHVDLRNDLSIQYGETNKNDTYFTRKRVVGSKGCFRPIEIELTFDRQRRLLDRQIQGGTYLDPEDFISGENVPPT